MKLKLGQETALRTVWSALADKDTKYLSITGPAGTGKSEVIREIANQLDQRCKAISKLLNERVSYELMVTATTNKAVDALNSKSIKGVVPITIYRALGLRVVNGNLVRNTTIPLINTILVIDEASYVDDKLLHHVTTLTDDTCKVIFVGDPYQLSPIGCDKPPVYEMDIETVELTEIVRQSDDNPIQALSLELREFVKGGPCPKLTVDDKHIFLFKDEDAFVDTAMESFKQGRVTKFIGYSNAIVNNANAVFKAELEQSECMKVGDTLVNNHYVNLGKKYSIRTDEEVTINAISLPTRLQGYDGNFVTLTQGVKVFCPTDKSAFKDTLASKNWVDLRSAYACTIHKSQGSTYQDVFIHLNELRDLSDNSLSRLLYVAVSRAADRVYFMGDL